MEIIAVYFRSMYIKGPLKGTIKTLCLFKKILTKLGVHIKERFTRPAYFKGLMLDDRIYVDKNR